MFEITLSTALCDQDYFSEIYKRMFSEVKADSGILIKQNYAGRTFLAFALKEEKKEYYKAKIMNEIVFMIIDKYKYEFFDESLLINSSDYMIKPFLKAISIFDADLDRQMIEREIELPGVILIDSLYHFKLSDLKSRWAKMAAVINQNQILSSKSSMIEVMKYLVSTSENIVFQTEVQISSKQIKLKDFTKTKCFKRNGEGQSGFLTEMIRRNPSKINLKFNAGSDEEDELFVVLNKIFDDKIYVLS